MNRKDAFSILNIQTDTTTPEEIKNAYRKAAAKYHPDHNPAGLEMMKLVNLAYDTLKDYAGTVDTYSKVKNYGEVINQALNAIISLGLDIEVCGAWVWVGGDTKTYREELKTAGYSWSPKKLRWYFRPEEYKSTNRTAWSMDEIRDRYGSESIRNEQRQIAANWR